MSRRRMADLTAIALFAALALAFVWDGTLGGKALLPADNLYRMEPWKATSATMNVEVPHNELISDMVLQNISWKRFAADEVRSGSPPLWNPYVLAGAPFLAAGQNGAIYPLGALFYLISPERAYGWFLALHLFLGALFMYAFVRLKGVGSFGGIVSGITFAYSGFVVVSFLWPMVVSTLIWIPALMFGAETIIRSQERASRYWMAWVSLTAVAVGAMFLAGHLEMAFYGLFTMGFYSVGRLIALAWRRARVSVGAVTRSALLLAVAVGLGAGAAGALLVPFYELIGSNYRTGWSTLEEVVGYALPKSQALVFLIPNVFGNPTHHTYLDVVDWTVKQVGLSSLGQPTSPPNTIYWGVKNYVEAAGYVGLLPLILAAIALVRDRSHSIRIFAMLALLSLSLVIGAPVYALFYFGIPGFEQLHTPFRWILPYSVGVAVLAGFGADWVANRVVIADRGWRGKAARFVALGSASVGALALVGAAVSRLKIDRSIALAQSFLERNASAAAAFADGRMLYSYEVVNLALFGAFLFSGGLLVSLLSIWRGRLPERAATILKAATIVVLVADLFVFGRSFNSYVDPSLLTVQPRAVVAVQDAIAKSGDVAPGRIVSFGDEDVLKPITGMMFGLYDARGYDTVIPKQYVEYWSLIEPPQGLPYSMIHKLSRLDSLNNRLLDLLGVRYVFTTRDLGDAAERLGLREIEGGETRVYERTTALPRAFLVGNAVAAVDRGAALEQVGASSFDPARIVILEGDSPPSVDGATCGSAVVTEYRAQTVAVTTSSAEDCYLVLADSYFTGWQATVDGTQAPIWRADGNFRGVFVPAGSHVVSFKYSPMSLKIGLYVSLISTTILILLAGVAIWRRATTSRADPGSLARVSRNSIAPMATSLLNKAVDFGFAMLMLRLLGPEDSGKYYFAVVVYGYLDILTNFGLNVLLIREVARDHESRHRLLTGSIAIRLGIWAVLTPLTLGGLYLTDVVFGLAEGSSTDTLITIAILAASLVPSNVAVAISSLFSAFERMEVPATLAVIVNLVRICLGAVALFLGWGIVGLGVVAFVGAAINAIVFAVLLARTFGRPRVEFHRRMIPSMLGESFPLMLNHLLATVFFKIDTVMLYYFFGPTVVGYYGAAYKFIDGLQIIPSSITFALFPMFSRRAGESPDSLRRAYILVLRVLTVVAFPIAAVTSRMADLLALLLGGSEFLPHSAIALQVLVWFVPFSFVNGVTQYVLIAVNRQRFITISFVIATSFNILSNLIVIPRYGYVGAGVITIFSEIALMVPFFYCIRTSVGSIPLLSILGRPALAAIPMLAGLWLLDLPLAASVPLGMAVYLLALIPTRSITLEEAKSLLSAAAARLPRSVRRVYL